MNRAAKDTGIGDFLIVSGAGQAAASAAEAPVRELVLKPARTEIVFVANSVDGYRALIDTLRPGLEVIVLDCARDGVEQIAEALAGRSGVDALHIMTHGAQGSLDLGTVLLDARGLDAYRAEMATIAQAMSVRGDILLYGCHVGAGGAELLQELAIRTGAGVAASDDLTGAASLGGDWDLEVVQGSVETPVAVDAQQAALFDRVLALPSYTVTFGTPANFVNSGGSTADDDVVYQLANPAYKLVIDGEVDGVKQGPRGSYAYASYYSIETAAHIRFEGGQVFTPTSLRLSALSGGGHTVLVTALDASGNPMGMPVEVILTDGGDWHLATLTGLTDVSQLRITPKEWSTMGYVGLDDIVLKDIRSAPPADTTPPTLSITHDATGTLKSSQTATISFTFSEDPGSTFDSGDVTVSAGTLAWLATTGPVRTATYTPPADTDLTTVTISVATGSYADAAGNGGGAASRTIVFDTRAPAAPSAPDMAASSDTGASNTDNTTSNTRPTFTGTVEANAIVTVFHGGTEIGTTSADGAGNWSFTPAVALHDGVHNIRARATDAAGNASALSPDLAVTIDTSAPAPSSIPDLASATDTGVSDTDNITADATPTFTGTAEAGATVTLYGSDGATVLGTTTADGTGAWSITASTLADGEHALTIRQRDVAGNVSAASAALHLTVDTVAPAAPPAPTLAASSDSGIVGDRITTDSTPTVEGTALAGALVTLYDAGTVIGSTVADASGNWSITSSVLSAGPHRLTVRQSDAAGNLSDASVVLALHIEAPRAPRGSLFDGVWVEVYPVTLPGGTPGTGMHIPIVTPGRVEMVGRVDVADIPLATQGGANLLLAQVAPGFGLTSTGGPAMPAGNALDQLIATITAATPSHAPADQGHLVARGQDFLSMLPSAQALLVQTVVPVSSPITPAGSLALSGTPAGNGQHVALVIDSTHLAPGSTIGLQDVDFAAVIGSANIVSAGGGAVLSGDAASQSFTIAPGGASLVFAGGGNDTLVFGLPEGAGAGAQDRARVAPGQDGVTLLHGGHGDDAATFNGNRDSFDVEVHNGYVVVSSKAAPGQKALVVNAEQLKFSDVTVAVQANSDMATIAGLYQNVLGRQADLFGFEFWADAHDAGMGWGAIALHMIASNEGSAAGWSFNGDSRHDVAILYEALLDRAGDAAGLDYWTRVMREHGVTLEQVAEHMVRLDEMATHQLAPADWNFFV
jgi:hypothetical protein